MDNKFAIVTFVVGRNHLDIFEIVKPSWVAYAGKCKADLVVVDDYVDRASLGGRAPMWQKLLVVNLPMLRKYEQVLFLDVDILINPDSPSIFDTDTRGKVGIVRHQALFYPEIATIQHLRYLKLMGASEKGPEAAEQIGKCFVDYYSNYGLSLASTLIFNTGVMLFSPSIQGQFFEGIYHKYEMDAFDQEQTALNYELIDNENYIELDFRFNAQVGAILSRDYPFLHLTDEQAVRYLSNANFCDVSFLCLNNVIELNYFAHFSGLKWPFLVIESGVRDGFTPVNFKDAAKKIWGANS